MLYAPCLFCIVTSFCSFRTSQAKFLNLLKLFFDFCSPWLSEIGKWRPTQNILFVAICSGNIRSCNKTRYAQYSPFLSPTHELHTQDSQGSFLGAIHSGSKFGSSRAATCQQSSIQVAHPHNWEVAHPHNWDALLTISINLLVWVKVCMYTVLQLYFAPYSQIATSEYCGCLS